MTISYRGRWGRGCWRTACRTCRRNGLDTHFGGPLRYVVAQIFGHRRDGWHGDNLRTGA